MIVALILCAKRLHVARTKSGGGGLRSEEFIRHAPKRQRRRGLAVLFYEVNGTGNLPSLRRAIKEIPKENLVIHIGLGAGFSKVRSYG